MKGKYDLEICEIIGARLVIAIIAIYSLQGCGGESAALRLSQVS